MSITPGHTTSTAITPKTTLNRSPPADPFVSGLNFGSTIDAITGEILGKVVDTSQSKPVDAPTGEERESYSFKQFNYASDVQNSLSGNFSSSILFPLDGLNSSLKQGFDFSSSQITQVFSVFYLISWETAGRSQSLPENPTISSHAQKLIENKDWAGFRNSYGDYFVYQIQTSARLSVLWRCTGSTETDMKKFQSDLNLQIQTPANISANAAFEAALKKSASSNNISHEVQFDSLGIADDDIFNVNDISATFTNFRNKVKPVNSSVIYRHNSWLNSDISAEIDIAPDIYNRLVGLFSTATFVLFLNGVAPGTSITRMQRRSTIVGIYSNIYSKRSEQDYEELDALMKKLSTIRSKLLTILESEELVLKFTNMSVDDIKSSFHIDHTTKDEGAWVHAAQGKPDFRFGETVPNPKLGTAISTSHFQFKQQWIIFQQLGTLDFPASGVSGGTAVGITVKPNRTDGTNGYWCIPTSNPLGKSAFKVEVKTDKNINHGMDWTMLVNYLPDEQYINMLLDDI